VGLGSDYQRVRAAVTYICWKYCCRWYWYNMPVFWCVNFYVALWGHLAEHSMALDCHWRNKGISVGLYVTNRPAVLKCAIFMFRYFVLLPPSSTNCTISYSDWFDKSMSRPTCNFWKIWPLFKNLTNTV